LIGRDPVIDATQACILKRVANKVYSGAAFFGCRICPEGKFWEFSHELGDKEANNEISRGISSNPTWYFWPFEIHHHTKF
jgi:hypothetical protein